MAKAKLSYWGTFSESGKILFNDYRLFVPSAFMLVIGMLLYFIPGYNNFFTFTMNNQTPSIGAIFNFVTILIIFIIINLIITGWEFLIVKNTLSGKKFKLFSGFGRLFYYAWVIFSSALLLILAILIPTVILIGIFGYFGQQSLIMTIIGIILIIAAIILFLLLITYSVRLSSVILMEQKGSIKSIAISLKYYKKRFFGSIKIFLMFLAIIIPLLIINLILTGLIFGFKNVNTVMYVEPLKYVLVMLPYQIIITIISILFIIFLARCYQKDM